MIYGQGKFENHKNHITLFFDSIPNLNQQKSAIAGDAVKSCKYITNEKIVVTVLSNGSIDLDGRVILKKDQ